MSSTSLVEVIVCGVPELLKAVAECGAAFQEAAAFQTDDGKHHAVDYVVTAEDARVGVSVDQQTGKATFIPFDCHGTQGKRLAGQVVQRYAYSRALGELKKKGYQITKEERAADGTIRLVADRWR